MQKTDYDKLLPKLPPQPGVYRFVSEEGEILYVGKAKSLKSRVSNYFTGGKSRTYKTRILVRQAEKVEFTIVETEQDALLLENSLIKEHQPRYNVVWKDDKSYTYIVVKNERFPRVFFTRKVIKDGSTYFGPYASKWKAKIVLDLIKSLFPLRSCSLNLSKKNITEGKFKVCLEYHIKNCLGPCVGYESEEEYNERISQVKNMLRGKLSEVKKFLKKEMDEFSQNLAFEKAQAAKEKLRVLEDYQSKSTVVSTKINDLDVFALVDSEKSAYIHYLKVVDGFLVHTYNLELTKNLNDNLNDILRFAVMDTREKFSSEADEIVLPFNIQIPIEEIKITVPQRGEKKQLLELAEKNGQYFLKQKQIEAAQRVRKESSEKRILQTLKDDLQMEEMPLHIECFDNSNIQGKHPTAACVVFKQAKPSKKDYRHFHVKTVVGPDDFASMREIVYRRYSRLLKENKGLPQLIIIDGGKGQLSAAVQSLNKLEILDKVTVIGIAKKLEEIYFPGDSIPLYINKKSESLKLIQQARNEAHRFAINFHRDVRSKDFTNTVLTDIEGIGQKTAELLLKKYGSVKRLLDQPKENVEQIIGKKKADNLFSYFNSDS